MWHRGKQRTTDAVTGASRTAGLEFGTRRAGGQSPNAPPDDLQKFMSRIPVPSHSPSNHRGAGAQRAVSPVPFPDRSASPLPGGLQRHQTQASMSSVSSSMAETRKKQSKRDEVSASASLSPPCYVLLRAWYIHVCPAPDVQHSFVPCRSTLARLTISS